MSDWNDLYSYVKKEIMGYDENQALSKMMILRLQGMRNGKYIDNSAIEDIAHYSYEIILLTYKYVKPRIEYKLKENNFNDDMHKFDYVAKIVGENLNLVYGKVKKIKEEKKKLDEIEVNDLPNYENKYVSKEDTNVDKKLEGFW